MDIYTKYSPKNDYNNIGLFSAIIAIMGVVFVLMRNTQKELTVNGYVVNTYLYVLLAILLCSFMIMIMDKYDLLNNINSMMMLCIFIITLLVLSAILMIDKRQVVLRHILWVIFLVGIAVILFPVYDFAKHTSILWKSVLTVIILILGLTYIASRFPRDYFQSWGIYLSVGLLGFIIFQVLDLIFSDPRDIYSRQKIYGIIGILLFSAFLLYDTNKMYLNAEENVIDCQGITNQIKCADYPGESLNLFIDIINLFSSTVRVQMS